MENWKTTLTAIATAIASFASHYNIVIPADFQLAVVTIGLTLIGWLSSDANNNKDRG